MNSKVALVNRLREVLLNGHWIANTNYKEQILDISWQEATRKIGDLNTIAALTYHINYYLAGLLKAFETGKLDISDKYSFDLPPIQTQNDWDRLVQEFLDNSEKFIAAVEQMEDSTFDQPFVEKKYGSYLRNLDGLIEHSYYHLGQIALIKKMIRHGEKKV